MKIITHAVRGFVTVCIKLPFKSSAMSSIITPVFQPTFWYYKAIAFCKVGAFINAKLSFTGFASLPTIIF
jgi:hypothetical protein